MLSVEPFEDLPAKQRAAAEPDAVTIAEHLGAEEVELHFTP